MENSESEEPEKKRPHLNSPLLPTMTRNSSTSPPDNKSMKHYVIEAVRSTKEDRHLAINLESALLELMDAEKELKWLKYAVSSSQKEYDQIQKKIDEIQTELVSERSERKMLEEELMELNNRVAELISETGEAAIQRLQDEIKDCKSMLKCSVFGPA